MGQTQVDEALYRAPNPADGGAEHTLGAVHPGWRIAGERSGDLFVTHTAGGAFSDPANPLPGNHGGPLTSDNTFAVVGGGAHRAPAVAGRRGRRPLRRHAAQPGPGPERRRGADGAGAARPLRAARQRGAGADGGVRAGRDPGGGQRPTAAGGGARCAGQNLRSVRVRPRGPRAADRLPAHRRRARRRRRVPPVARADDPRQPARGPLPRARAVLRVAGARRAAAASTSCGCGPGATCGGWRSGAARRDSRRCRRTSGRAAATRCGCSSSSGRCSGAATTAPWTSRSGCAPRRSCGRGGGAPRTGRAPLSRAHRPGGHDPPAAARVEAAGARRLHGPHPDLGRQPHADRAARPAAPVATVARRGVPGGQTSPRRSTSRGDPGTFGQAWSSHESATRNGSAGPLSRRRPSRCAPGLWIGRPRWATRPSPASRARPSSPRRGDRGRRGRDRRGAAGRAGGARGPGHRDGRVGRAVRRRRHGRGRTAGVARPWRRRGNPSSSRCRRSPRSRTPSPRRPPCPRGRSPRRA